MSQLPPPGTSPAEFFEQFVPQAFAANPLPDAAKQIEVKLGVKLDGDGGGEWSYQLKGGQLAVSRASTEDAAFTLVQSVDDWRGALWEGRGGAFGKQSQALLQPGGAGAGAASAIPGALQQLQMLRGLVRMVVTGGPGGDWAVGFKLGPGPIPDPPTTTLTIGAADADAMERGELDPMQAFMSGRIQIAGDMTLLMQMQAIQMQAQAAAAAPKQA
jgi:putative sterol carrier protein